MKVSDFIFPDNVLEAQSYMRDADDKAFLIAGGTSVRFLKETEGRKVAVDITGLPFKGIEFREGYYKIGSLTKINDLMKYSGKGWVLDKVARLISTQQIRNISTIGGNIARVFYWCDLPVALLALDSRVTIKGYDWFTVESDEYFNKQPLSKLVNGNIVGYVEIPALVKGEGFAYHKETRTYAAFSSLNVAVFISLDKNKVNNIRIVTGACTPFPVRLKKLEKQLLDKKIKTSEINKLDFSSIDKLSIVPKEGMSKVYCRHLIKTRVKDTLLKALDDAEGKL